MPRSHVSAASHIKMDEAISETPNPNFGCDGRVGFGLALFHCGFRLIYSSTNVNDNPIIARLLETFTLMLKIVRRML